jgi:membrane-associated PAP2 superfamily phosphatase
MFRKQLLVVTIALIIEIPVAALSWSYVDWREWILGAIATTVLFLALLVAIILKPRKAALP